MPARRALFSDLDGTLCFHEEAHGVRVVGRDGDGTLLVAAPGETQPRRAYDVSTSSYRIYVADETLRLLRALASRFEIVLVTGGRPSTVERRRALFDFAAGYVLENGGVVCDGDLRPDGRWQERLEPQRRLLPAMAARLRQAGWALDAEGRTSALRVRLRDNPGRTADDLAALGRDLASAEGLRTTMNLDNLDIILAGAGKENAVRFWIESRGHDPRATVGIGDDVNDVEFLRLTASAHVLASSYPAAIAAARAHGWSISSAAHFAGIHEILRRLLESSL